VTEELKKEGFGILTTIDVQATLRQKLGAGFPRYVILGACDPLFAQRALLEEEDLGLLLPCNMIVREKDERTVVSMFDPMVMIRMVGNPAIHPLAGEVKAKPTRVIAAV
jgi:uncharacterized protein (DUF302 family)